MDEMTLEELPKEAQEVAEIIGIDNYLRLSDTYGGFSLYIFCTKRINKSRLRSKIQTRYRHGATVKELIREFDLSESTIRRIIKERD